MKNKFFINVFVGLVVAFNLAVCGFVIIRDSKTICTLFYFPEKVNQCGFINLFIY
jgi:hypothetical protein